MSNKKGFITLTVVFEAMSLNRDEGMGNIQTLHLLTRGNGKTYSYMSRQALTYAVRKFLIESGEWPETPVRKSGDVTQYETDIKNYPEVDLFGYMTTEKAAKKGEGSSTTRPAVVTFTHAVSLEPYNSDMAFYANIEMARRSNSNPNPYNKQEHRSLYKYSIVIDLERVGKEENNVIHNEEKVKRIKQLLDAILSLSHQISAYREPLYPLFITGAHLRYGSPIFHNYVELIETENNTTLNGNLFTKGISHAEKILKINSRISYAIIKGAGDLHLDITPIPKNIKENPVEVIEEIKKWVEDVYKD